jgi:thioredoxin reductase
MVRDDVTALSLTGPVKTVTDGAGTTWPARTVILAMGSAYRQIGTCTSRHSNARPSWAQPPRPSPRAERS